MAPIILFLIYCHNTFSRVPLNIGDNIQVLSDKAYRIQEKDIFEATGNVVINYKQGTIYGEKVTLSLKKKEALILGDVRYVGDNETFYASELKFNLKTDEIF